MTWLKQYWFLIITVVTASIAWGQTITQVAELDRRITERMAKEQKVDLLSEGQSRLDERTRLILDEQRLQRGVLNEILQDLRKNNR